MIEEIVMPDLSAATDEVMVVGWFKFEGDYVEEGESLFEVETDKASMEVEAYKSGYIKKIVVEAQETVTAGDVLAYIGDEDDDFEEMMDSQDEKTHESEEKIEKEEKASEDEIKVSPMVRKLAEKKNVDITSIRGSGPDGLILKEDILKADSEPSKKGEEDKRKFELFNKAGKAVASKMAKSKKEIPHVYFKVDIKAKNMVELYQESKKTISYNTMIIKNLALCLEVQPYLAAKYSEKNGKSGRKLPESINIGLAMARGNDLYVPVIKNLGKNRKDLNEIESEVQLLQEKVNTNDLKEEDLTGGVFTVSNLGKYDITSFAAIINPPETGILSVGKIEDRVTVENGGIVVQPMFTMVLSADHRVVNGTYAAEFLTSLKSKLENIKD